ncbi:hypothetical protein DFJ63DRAFT_314067 [Scheffersomyces coipomensis]|uniref:uncharacterized protein n=1 Tax=Scheffersomyces coipomensis TaxID=1788519 RepID=UPI00315CF9B8
MTSTATSTSAVLSTLVANLVLFSIFVVCFLLLRLKFKRIYSPKSSFDIVPEEQRPVPLPKDPFSWIFILLTKPHSFVIQQAGMDGYLFLRFLFMFGLIFLFGMLTWTVLLPINATNGNGGTGLDQLSISNVKNRHRYYAHAFMSWIYYGGVIFVIYRELFFYNSLRTAVLSSPKYAKKLSSRTVLFQSVPDTLLDEKQFFKLFNGVKRIYVPRTQRELEGKINKRIGLVNQLEAAENKLLKTAVKAKLKADKKNEVLEPVDEISAYVPEKKRPKHKVGGFFSKKTDTIRYCQEEIPKINDEIYKLQKKFRTSKPKNSIFVEFENQYYAQLAYQSTVHHNPLRMKPSFTGLEPADINWSNLRLFWWERIARRAIAGSAVVALIILWAIPVAFVGVISNITYLTNKLPWLRWILKMPHFLLGLITGLLPTILLAILMMLLPMFIRGMAQVAGAPSLQHVELFTQRTYFAFLTINGFLVTALASSATSTVTQIIDKPTSALTILANNLPKSSNFYISYIILQGLSVSSGALFQVVGLFLYYILGYFLDSTVRKKWTRFSGLGAVAWGTTFPIFTNLASIALIYSIIAPMILLFACVAFFLVFIAYAHNLTYIFIESPDTRGLHYPIALFQIFTGIYIGQVCLLGIFAVGKGWGPIVLQVIGILATIFFHIHLKEAFDPLLGVIPIDCMRALDGVSNTASYEGASEYQSKVLDRKNKRKSVQTDKQIEEDAKATQQIKQDLIDEDLPVNSEENNNAIVPLIADRDFKTTESKNPIVRFIRPDVFLNYRHARRLIPATYHVEPDTTDDRHAYDMPIVSAVCAGVWIPEDPMGLSKIEIKELSSIVNITDENSGFDEKGNIKFLGEAPN